MDDIEGRGTFNWYEGSSGKFYGSMNHTLAYPQPSLRSIQPSHSMTTDKADAQSEAQV